MNVGMGVVWLPNASRLTADSRVESTFTRSRGFTGVRLIAVTGPGMPVAANLIDVLTPLTDAVTRSVENGPDRHVAVA